MAAAHSDMDVLTAASKGDIERVKTLLDAGANINVQDPTTGRTAIYIASVNGSPELVKLLLERGADPNIQDARGLSPIHAAILFKRMGIAAILLSHKGIHLNTQDKKTGHTPLHSILELGYYTLFLNMVAAGANLDIPDKLGDTPRDLMPDHIYGYATKAEDMWKQHMDEIKIKAFMNKNNVAGGTPTKDDIINIIRHGDLEAFKRYVVPGSKFTPSFLGYAIEYNKNAIIEYILTFPGIDINNIVEYPAGPYLAHGSALFLAALKNNAQIVNALLEKGADQTIGDIEYDDAVVGNIVCAYPLYAAMNNNNEEIVNRLLKAEKGPSGRVLGACLLLCLRKYKTHPNYERYAKIILDMPTDVKIAGLPEGIQPLFGAIMADNPEFVMRILEKNNTYSSDLIERTIAHISQSSFRMNHKKEILKQLFHVRGIHIENIIHIAISNQIYQELVESLIEEVVVHPAIMTKKQIGYLLTAVIRINKPEFARLLLTIPDIHVNERVDENTALFYAAYYGMTEIVEKLLKIPGIDLNAYKSLTNSTALLIAINKGHVAVARLLIEAGADVNLPTNNNLSPLINAVHIGSIELVKLLLERHANVNIQQTPGFESALHVAVMNKNEAIVRMLLDVDGIDITLRTSDGKTALDLAREKHYKHLVEILTDKVPKWKGWSREDVSHFNMVLDTTPPAVGVRPPSDNWSTCPVCLAYAERTEGCMYMSHKCSVVAPYFHKKLYETFNSGGNIDWCTICGRICKTIPTPHGNTHKHYEKITTMQLNDRMAKVLEPQVDPRFGLYYGADKECRQFGGGGYEEKIIRMRKMREYALAMNEDKDVKTYEDAWNELVEETWNAPFSLLNVRKGKNVIAKKAWNIPNTAFPEPPRPVVEAEHEPVPLTRQQYWPFQGKPIMMPIVHVAGGMNNTLQTEYPIVFQLRHRQVDGSIKTHAVKVSLEGILLALVLAVGTEEFGTCRLEGEFGCTGIIYPGEVQHMLDVGVQNGSVTEDEKAVYQGQIDKYKAFFTKHFHANAHFREHIAADIAAAETMAVGGVGAAPHGGGRRRTRRQRRQGTKRKTI